MKIEATAQLGTVPQLRHSVVAQNAGAVVSTIERFAGEMDEQYRELRGTEFDPASGQSQLLVISAEVALATSAHAGRGSRH